MTSDGGAHSEAAAGEAKARRALPVKKRKGILLDAEAGDEKCQRESANKKSKGKSKKKSAKKESQEEQQEIQNGQGRESATKEGGIVEEGAPHAKSAPEAASSPAGFDGKDQGAGISPQINDVLMDRPSKSRDGLPKSTEGPGSTFHHIGNRRFRVLVEVNLSNYFGGASTEEGWEAALSEESQESEDVAGGREGVVRSVIESVEGNNPGGRFLIRDEEDGSSGDAGDVTENGKGNGGGHDEKPSEPSEEQTEADFGSNWKRVTREEIVAKVHATFMAAGRFHAKSVAALARAARETEQMEEAAAEGGQEPEVKLEGDVEEAPAAAMVTEDAEESNESDGGASDEELGGTEELNGTQETSAKEEPDKKSTEVASSSEIDRSEAMSRYSARSQNMKAIRLAESKRQGAVAALQEALLAANKTKAAGKKKNGRASANSVKKMPAKGKSKGRNESQEEGSIQAISSRDDEIKFLASESARFSTLLSSEAKKLANAKQNKKYCPSRNARKSSNAIVAAGQEQQEQPGEQPSLSFSTSVGDLFARAAATAQSRGSAPDLSAMTDTLRDAAPMPCPPRIRVFLALPMDRFFVEDQPASEGGVPGVVSPAVSPPIPRQSVPSPPEYLVPSNYDILCGPGQAFFHHVGNRRFRIMIEMNAQRYEEAYLASLGSQLGTPPKGGEGVIQKMIDEVLASLSRCDPPGRFLGMEMTTGRWRVLNPVYAQLKVEQTFYECVKVGRLRRQRERAEQQRALQEQALQEARRQEWMRTIELEKDALLEELDRRMSSAGIEAGRIGREDGASAVAAAACPLRSGPGPLVNEDLSALQCLARTRLSRRHAPLSAGMNPTAAAALSEPDAAVITELIAERTARAQQRGRGAKQTNAAQSRRSSLPVQPFSSSALDQGGNVTVARAKHRSERSATNLGHNVSSSSAGNVNDEHKDLMDVVGGMLSMSRRGSM